MTSSLCYSIHFNSSYRQFPANAHDAKGYFITLFKMLTLEMLREIDIVLWSWNYVINMIIIWPLLLLMYMPSIASNQNPCGNGKKTNYNIKPMVYSIFLKNRFFSVWQILIQLFFKLYINASWFLISYNKFYVWGSTSLKK